MISKISRLVLFRSRGVPIRGSVWARRVTRRVGSLLGVGIKLFGGVAVVVMSTMPSHVWANPAGEQVVGGAAAFNRPDAATLIVNQGTDRAVINWNSFSIANGELTRFVQPSSTSAALNRVVTANPSQIYGTLQANGQLYLINPGGVMVGPGGVVDVAGFVASTRDINSEEFMKGGQLNFQGNSDASVVNQGNITAREGDVFLIAKEVKNEGQLMAKDGTVGMVSGTEVSLQAVGQGNYKVRLMAAETDPTSPRTSQSEGGSPSRKASESAAEIVNEGVIQAANAVLEAKGSYLPMAIKNTGVIEATGLVENGDGSVTLTGGEGDILNTGVVAALQRSLDGQKETGGTIEVTGQNILLAAESIMTAAGADGGGKIRFRAGDMTLVAGSLEVTGRSAQAKGGRVELLGENVGLLGQARVNADGGAGGGTVLVGGDYLGRNPQIANAQNVVMGPEAVISADAKIQGDGGKVVLWSDQYTGFYGTIFAQGGLEKGNGGFVETSSKINLQAFGSGGAGAPNGEPGLWLLDPVNVEIVASIPGGAQYQNGIFDYVTPTGVQRGYIFSPGLLPIGTGAVPAPGSQILASFISGRLNGTSSLGPNNVAITTENPDPTNIYDGDITVSAGITWNQSTTLRLRADDDIFINAPISGTGGAVLELFSQQSGFDAGDVGIATQTANIVVDNLLLNGLGDGTLLNQDNNFNVLAGQDLFGTIGVRETGGFEIGTVTAGSVDGFAFTSVTDPLTGTIVYAVSGSSINATTANGIAFIRNRQNQDGSLVFPDPNLVLTSTGGITQTQPILVSAVVTVPVPTSPTSAFSLNVTSLNDDGADILLNNSGNDVDFVSLRTLSANGTVTSDADIRFDDTDGFRITGPGMGILSAGGVITIAPTDGSVAGGVITSLGTINSATDTAILGGGNIVLSAGRSDTFTGVVLNGVVDQLDDPLAPSFIQGARIGFLGNPIEYNLFGTTVGASNDIQLLTAYLTEGGNLNYEDSNGFQIMSLDFRTGEAQADFIPGVRLAGSSDLAGLGNLRLVTRTGTEFNGIRLAVPQGPINITDGGQLLNGFITAATQYFTLTQFTNDRSPGHIEATGSVEIVVKNGTETANPNLNTRFTMDEATHIFSGMVDDLSGWVGVNGVSGTVNGSGVTIVANNIVLGADTLPWLTNHGLIMTSPYGGTVSFQPWGNSGIDDVFANNGNLFRSIQIVSPKADYAQIPDPGFFQLTQSELRRINAARVVLSSSESTVGTPAIEVRSPLNLYGLYADTSISGIFPNNPGYNRIEMIATGAGTDPGVVVSADVSSDVNQKSLQMFFSSQDGRTVINAGLRSYGGDIGIQGQLIDLGGAINASSTGLVALLPGQAGRDINLGQKDDLNALGLLRSEIALITAGTVQIGSLPTFAYPTVLEPNSPQLIQILDPATGLKIGNYLGTNPLWSFNTVDAGAISITDSFARLSLDTMALVTSAGITQDPGAGLELPGLFVVGAPALGTDYLLGGNLNRVDRLAVALADTTEESIPTGDLLFVNQKGLIGGNGGEVARKQQQWTESLTRSTTTPATYTGVGLVVANALSISAKGSVGIYEIMPAGLTGLGYIGHVAANPNVANEVAASNVGNQIGRVGGSSITSGLAIDATENELGASGANTVFVAAARGLAISDLDTGVFAAGGNAGILNNGGTVTIEGNAIEIAGSLDRLSGDDITIDTTGDGVAPAGGRVVIRPATGLNGFQNRAGSGAFDYNLQNSPLAGAPVEMRFGLNTIDGINALTGAPGQFLDAGYDTVFLSATALSETAIRGSTVEIGRNSDISTATGKFTLMASLGTLANPFTTLLQNLSLISGGAVETSDNMAGGITLTVDGGLAVQANGTVGLVGDIDQLAVDAAGGTENLRFIDTDAGMTIGTVDDVVGLLATTVYLQSNGGGIAQAAGATIQAASGGIALRAIGSIRLDQENDFNLAAAFAGTNGDPTGSGTWQPIYLRTAGPLTVSTFGPGQPGGQPFPLANSGDTPFENLPAGVVGIQGSNVSLLAGGDLVQSDLAVIRASESFLATVLDGSDVVLASTANELGVNPIIAALKTDGTLGSIANLEIKTAGDVALGAGGILVVDLIGAGSGYTSAPTLTVNGVATTDLVPILGLQSIAISSGGQGYQQAPEVKLSGGGGVGAQAVAIVDENPLSETFGQVIRITVTNAGTGYTGNVDVNLTGGGFTEAATGGTVTLGLQRINVVDPTSEGFPFSSTPTIGFIGGGGSGATATATIGGTGGLVLSGTTTVIGGITGNLILQTAGNITNGSGLAVGGTTTLSAGDLLNPSSINLSSVNNNLVGAIQVTSFGNTTINNANSLALGNFTVGGGGNLVLGSRGNIYQESIGAALVVTGTSDFYATSTAAAGGTPNGVVILNNTRNDFVGTVTAQGTRIAIRATGDLDLGTMVASQSLTASSLLDLGAGTITMDGFSGTGSVALNAAVDVILTGAMSLTGPLSIVGGNNVDLLAVTVSGTGSSSVTAGGTVNLDGNGSYGGSLSLSGGGAGTAINQDVGTSLTVVGASTYTSTAGGEIDLVGNGQNNFKGTVILNQTTGDISLNNGQNLLTLGSSVLGSGTIVFQTGGGITQGSGTTIESDAGGLVTFNAGAGVITLVGSGNNNLAGTVNLSNTGANNVELTNGTNPLTLGNFIVGSGASTINAVGITQLAGTVASQEAGAGAATFNAGNGLINLVGGGNNDFTGTLNLANGGAFAVTVTDANGISLGQVNIGTGAFSLTANTAGGAGTISQSQAFTIQGATTLAAGALGTIDLGLANTFAGITVTSAQNVTLGNQAVNAGTLLFPALPATLQNLTLIFNNSPVTLPATSLTGTLSVTAGGLIEQSGILAVSGTATFETANANINLSGFANQFSGPVSLITSGGGTVDLENAANLSLGTVTMGSGSLAVSTAAANGNINQTGSLVLTGNASFSAGTGNITLNNTGNDFGNVQVIGNNVTLVDRTGLSFTVPSTIAGTLSVTAGGDVLWDNTAGNSAGLVTIASTGDVDVILGAGQGGVGQPGELGPIQASGTFTLQSPDTINLNSGGGGVDISTTQLQKLTVGSLVVDSGADINLGDFSSLPGIPSVELVAAVNINGNGVIGVNGLSLTAGGSANFSAVNQVANLGQITTGGGGFTFRNGQGLSITAPITVTGNVDLRVAGQFYNQSGSAQPFGGTTGSVTVRSLSLAGGLPNLISGLAGFSVGYNGKNPGGSRAMIYAVSPLTMFAPSGTFIAGIPGIDLGGTQTGGGQLNTFLTGSDNLNWMISDFGRFNMPTVKPSGMDYILYPQRVEPETRTLPAATLGQLERELGRPPTLDEIQAREVAVREAAIVRSGAILERTSFDAVEDEVDKQESAEVPAQVIDGGKPQAGGPSVAPNPLSGGAMEGFEPQADARGQRSEDEVQKAEVGSRQSAGVGPQASKQTDSKRDPNGPMLRSGPKSAVALRAEPVDATQIIQAERERAEVGVAAPVAGR